MYQDWEIGEVISDLMVNLESTSETKLVSKGFFIQLLAQVATITELISFFVSQWGCATVDPPNLKYNFAHKLV